MPTFKDIPSQTLVPFFWMEFDASQARPSSGLQPYKLIFVSQRLAVATTPWADATGYVQGDLVLEDSAPLRSYVCTVDHTSAAANDEPGTGPNFLDFWGEYTPGQEVELVPRQFTSSNGASTLFGRGSLLHGMAEALFDVNTTTEAWAVTLDDESGTTRAVFSIELVGNATAAGTLYVYVGGKRFAVGVSSGDTPAIMGAALAAALQADTALPIRASWDGTSKVMLVALNGGTTANALDIRFNYFTGEEFPAGITVPVVATDIPGATDPDVTTVWPVLGDVHYNVFGTSLTDTASLAAFEAELLDRFAPDRAIDAVVVVTLDESHATLLTTVSTRNSQHLSIMGGFAIPSPTWTTTARLVGLVARSASGDPALPFQNMVLTGTRAPKITDEFTLAEQELLLAAGIAIFKTNANGQVLIGRMVSTYTEDAQAAPDDTFRDINTTLTLGYFRWDLRNTLTAKFPQHKLADDGIRFDPGQAIVTPNIFRAEIIAIAKGWERRGLLENFDAFKKSVTVTRDVALDPNRLDVLIAPDLVNQFRVGRIQAQFVL